MVPFMVPFSETARMSVIKAQVDDLVECVMRNGLVVIGVIVWVSKYNLILRVGGRRGKGGKVVIAYKHDIYQFTVLKSKPKRPIEYIDAWDEEDD